MVPSLPCLRRPGKDHPAQRRPWSVRGRVGCLAVVTAGLLAAGLCAQWVYSHLQDTGVSLGRQAVRFADPTSVVASVFVSDEEHDAAMVKVARGKTLCHPDADRPGWRPRCRVLMAYENFAGRISKEDYDKAFKAADLTYKLVDKPGWIFQKYTPQMAWDPEAVTVDTYQKIKFHHQNYGEIRLWPLAAWAVCARQERSLAEVEGEPSAHLDVIREELYQYASFIEYALKELEAFRPDVVIVAQGHYHYGAGFRAAAILQGLNVVALETPINNRRLVWSTMSGISVDRGVERNLYWRYVEFVKADVAQAEVAKYLGRAKQSKMMVHASPTNTDELDAWLADKPRGKRIVAYLAQVYTDTAVILNLGQGFTSQAHVIWTVAQWAVEHRQPLIIKFHPRETPPKDLLPIYGPRLNHLTLRRLREVYAWEELVNQNKDILLMDNANSLDTYAIIDAADTVVTINSGTGLEALIKGREVVLAGNAYYGGLGFTHHTPGPDILRHTLTEVSSNQAAKLNDKDGVAKFFYIFNKWATVPKRAGAVVERACGFPGRWPMPKSQFCDDGSDDEDLGTMV
eukprot:jgi/Tetstr1/465932/TSEL_010546.t1